MGGPGVLSVCLELRDAPARMPRRCPFAVATQDALHRRFKVKFVCDVGVERLGAELHFDSSVLASEDASLLAEQMKTLVENASSRPDAALDGLELVGPRERHRLLVDFNDTRKPYSTGRCVHELFEDQFRAADAMRSSTKAPAHTER